MKAFTCLVAIFAALVQTAPAPELVVFEKVPQLPRGWTQQEAVPPQTLLKFRIALKLDQVEAFEQHVIDISTPGHVLYGQHMSYEELKRSLRPDSAASASVLGWLEAEGVSRIEDDGDWINFIVPAKDAERIMDTKFYYFHSSMNNERHIRTLQYSVPQTVRPFIQMIQPTIRFGQLKAQGTSVFKVVDANESEDYATEYQLYHNGGLNATFCNTTITPDCLRALYNIGDHKAFDGDNGNKLGINGFLKEYAKYDDLAQFLKTYAPQQNPQRNNFTYTLINGGLATQNDTVDDDIEANLDVQYAMSIGYYTPTTYYSTGGLGQLVPDLDQPDQASNANEPYLDFLHYVLQLPDDQLPTTLTTSYGEDEQSVPASYAKLTCSLFAQLGARGVSVLFASGDTGVGSACQTNDGKNTTRFLPTFPAGCPFVTAVGGTYHVQPERAISFSSGGFSDLFPRPAYQDAAVQRYLGILGSQWQGLYNPAGRGIPDVAAQAYNFSIIDRGRVRKIGGTSASSPTFAGVVALLNSARRSAHKKPLGFLNPWIYSSGFNGLTDITVGGSKGCTGRDIYTGGPTPFVPYASWNATVGWDPVTGYGTPNYRLLETLAMKA
jgi:tripeptidyl-peptidase-1